MPPLKRSKPKKVLLLCDFFSSLGGTEYYNATLAEALSNRGIEVKVYIGEKPRLSHWEEVLDANGVPHKSPKVHHKSFLDHTIETDQMNAWVAEINEWQPDIIHTHPFGKMATAWLDNDQSNKLIPIIATEWTTPGKNTSHWTNPYTQRQSKNVTCYIATCDAVYRGLREEHKYVGKIAKVPHLIIPATTIPAHTSITHHKVGCVARLSPEKGVDTLITSWRNVNRAYPGASLHIYGHGLEESKLKSLRDNLGLGDVIFFEGTFPPYTGIDTVASQHSIFVQPSLFESIPTSIIELMLRERIVVASSVGGIPEILDDSSGALVPPNNPEKLSVAIMKLLSTPEAIPILGQQASKIIQSRYQLDVTLDAIISVYADAMFAQGQTAQHNEGPCATTPAIGF